MDCTAAGFDPFDTVLDGSINVVWNVDASCEDCLTDQQRYEIVFHCLCFWGWAQEPNRLADIVENVTLIAMDQRERSFKGFILYLEQKYSLRPTEEGVAPIQQFLNDCADMAEEIEKREREMNGGSDP